MTNEELKAAFTNELPVVFSDMEYKCISAIIYRRHKSGSIIIQAELMDKNENSVSIVNPARITLAGG